MLLDCHSHSHFSCDSQTSPANMVAAAIERGVGIYAITDHCDMDLFDRDNLGDAIAKSVTAVRAMPQSPKIQVLSGIELGQALYAQSKADALLKSLPFDFVLGSLHTMFPDRDFYYVDFGNVSDGEVQRIFENYFENIYDIVKWNGFDSLAHITYPFRYLHQTRPADKIHLNYNRLDEAAAEALRLLIQNGKSLEQNARSLSRNPADAKVNFHFLQLYYNLGGRMVTVGSDAHVPENIGRGIGQACDQLREIGFTHLTYYQNRTPKQIAL